MELSRLLVPATRVLVHLRLSWLPSLMSSLIEGRVSFRKALSRLLHPARAMESAEERAERAEAALIDARAAAKALMSGMEQRRESDIVATRERQARHRWPLQPSVAPFSRATHLARPRLEPPLHAQASIDKSREKMFKRETAAAEKSVPSLRSVAARLGPASACASVQCPQCASCASLPTPPLVTAASDRAQESARGTGPCAVRFAARARAAQDSGGQVPCRRPPCAVPLSSFPCALC